MEGHHSGLMLRDALLMLGFALVAVLAFRRAGLGATLGYLVAGALLGPSVFGLVEGAEEMAEVAELGIVMLLFVVGLELSPERLWRLKNAIFGLGLTQVTLCGLVVSGVVLAFTDYAWAVALAIGLPLGLSSTAQVLPMLQSGGQLRTPFGERAFSILLFQDLSIIPLITIVAALGAGMGDGPSGITLALYSIAAVISLIAAGRLVIRPLFRLIGHLGERELFIVAALFTVLASAVVMTSLGLSAALGAFIAGVMLADTPYRHELEADIEPFRSILLGLFFVAVGMMLDLQVIADNPLFVVGFAILLISLKTAIIMGLGLLLKMTWRSALALGLLLSQGGEFAFVLYTQAVGGGLITTEQSSLFGAIVTLSMAATPFLMMATARIRQEPAESEDGTREGPRNEGARAIVVGYGRFGQSVAQTLLHGELSVTLIDRKQKQIDIAEEFGSKVYFGDGKRIDMLRQAGAADAQLIMFCNRDVDAELLENVKEAFPNAAIFARGYDRRSVIELAGSKADYIMREMFESAIRMALLAMEKLGLSQQAIDKAEADYRQYDHDRMEVQIESGDIYAAQEMTRQQQKRLRGEG
ncbi:cation:proton antiporter [Aurantiacibacter gangjinensis]|uniref:Sodium:proton exchanger n=1 Tax=Aurantiacibacter gangjinensis TaxID=502682 RepID=A0A0G9MK81_9SPHN|nr:cation:proton antiporter [Aurantiacibacter gangjinensis]APE29302.1 putative Glutathione-regulated potassium-efflux system protein KefB [Aurantiacibacter gangjinensis]KLE31105.1 sodium:proton exchanger [Aurantiacibacter gangjinensis]